MNQNQDHSRLQAAGSLLLVIAGNVLYALTVKLFLLPADLVTGGTTGIALAANHWLGIPIPLFVLVFNVAMLLIGFGILGKQFALTTVVSTFTYPAALELFGRLLGERVLTFDLLLCTLFSGLGIGLALGIVIRAGASTGGMDIPPLVFNKLFRIPVSLSLYVFDFCILLVLIYTVVLDRGVTVLCGEGGYLQQETQVILSVISNRELPRVEKLIRRIDPESFLVVSRVSEVRGRGFSMSKKYQ